MFGNIKTPLAQDSIIPAARKSNQEIMNEQQKNQTQKKAQPVKI